MCSRLIDRLAISDAAERARTLSKSEELYRLSKIKIRSLGNFETCRAALCVHIALDKAVTPAQLKLLLRFSGVKPKVYETMMARLQTRLGARRGNGGTSLRQLALQFRCTGILHFISTTLTTYKGRFVEGLPAQRRARADFSSPVFGAAALYLCAQKRGIRVDRKKLLKATLTKSAKFQQVLNSMHVVMFDTVGRGDKATALNVNKQRYLLEMTSSGSNAADDGAVDLKDESARASADGSASRSSSSVAAEVSSGSVIAADSSAIVPDIAREDERHQERREEKRKRILAAPDRNTGASDRRKQRKTKQTTISFSRLGRSAEKRKPPNPAKAKEALEELTLLLN